MVISARKTSSAAMSRWLVTSGPCGFTKSEIDATYLKKNSLTRKKLSEQSPAQNNSPLCRYRQLTKTGRKDNPREQLRANLHPAAKFRIMKRLRTESTCCRLRRYSVHLQIWKTIIALRSAARGVFFFAAQESLRQSDQESARRRRREIMCEVLSHPNEANEIILYEAADWLYFLPLSDPDVWSRAIVDGCLQKTAEKSDPSNSDPQQ